MVDQVLNSRNKTTLIRPSVAPQPSPAFAVLLSSPRYSDFEHLFLPTSFSLSLKRQSAANVLLLSSVLQSNFVELIPPAPKHRDDIPVYHNDLVNPSALFRFKRPMTAALFLRTHRPRLENRALASAS